MRFYQTPVKNPAATALSFVTGIVVMVALTLSIRVANDESLSRKTEPREETIPVDPALSDIQDRIQANRERKLRGNLEAPEKSETETKPAQKTVTVPAPSQPSPAPQKPKKADRTTRTS